MCTGLQNYWESALSMADSGKVIPESLSKQHIILK